jgi:hypothetical protein
MLKHLLLSGWFRVRPFLKYVVVVILIAPLVAGSNHSTAANQTLVAKNTFNNGKSGSSPARVAAFGGFDPAAILQAVQDNSVIREFDSAVVGIASVERSQLLPARQIESLAGEAIDPTDNALASSNVPQTDLLAAVQLAPSVQQPVNQENLVARLKSARIQSFSGKDIASIKDLSVAQSLAANQVAPNLNKLQLDAENEIPVSQLSEVEQAAQVDPLNSPHPIPWKWITATQEAIGSQGRSAVRYYRSVPVVSPDGKFVVYSRVKLEVKPEMFNSRVTSVLFVEDTQTKRLRVIASTAAVVKDPLLQTQEVSNDSDTNGTIGVLVPVSWSEKGDRFLARKFVGVFNTADSTDHAVIWDLQKNSTNTVAPGNQQDDHENIAILLGWSRSQPDNVLFRAGELGEEDWPLVNVASDGSTFITSTDGDQPITFGKKISEIWAGPPVASR